MIPTFFIVGAPRCGTSSLYLYLDAHPQIFMSKPKEPHHFGSDLDLRPRPYADREAYLKLFDGAGKVSHAGEASVLYLYSRTAPEEILALNPAARIIIMLRDPVEMICSLHLHNLLLNYEDIGDLEQALEAESDRREGRRIPPTCIPPLSLQYTTVAKYADHVVRYQEAFGRDRVLCVLFDDLCAEPESIYEQALSFLGLEGSGRPEFKAHNQGLSWRSQRAAQVLLPAYSRCYGLASKLPTKLLRLSALGMVGTLFYLPLKLNLRPAPTPPLGIERRRVLREGFREDVERLADLLGRDLSKWLRPEG
ncbi:MAG TPA: sulfotransferase [Vicinamibacteria bacterium]|nr:sulfotransferase [Vicinamibacteria bacterium]